MPSGAKKRKAAKKKKFNDSSTTTPHQGGEVSSQTSQDPTVEVEKREDNSSENKSQEANEGNVEIETGSKSKSSNGSSSSSSDSSDDETHVVDKKVVVLEPAPVESVPVIESLPEEIPPIVDPVKPVDSLLEEVSQVFDEIKNEEKKDLVVEEIPVVVEEQTDVISETASKDDCPTSSVVVESVSNEHEVEKLPLSDEKASTEPEDDASSMPPKDSISEANAAGVCANETDTVGHSDRQAQVVSTPLALQKTTSWKSCCGIFDLFTGSER